MVMDNADIVCSYCVYVTSSTSIRVRRRNDLPFEDFFVRQGTYQALEALKEAAALGTVEINGNANNGIWADTFWQGTAVCYGHLYMAIQGIEP